MKGIFNLFFPWIILLFLSLTGFGQTENIEDAIEKSAELVESDHDFSNIIEDLNDLSKKPVNLNKATEENISEIPFLSPVQRKALFEYIQSYGEMFSIYELATIPGLDSNTILKIQPYIIIAPVQKIPSPTPGNLVRFGHHDLLLRYGQIFPKSEGYRVDDSIKTEKPGSFYPGGPQRYYFRYTYLWFDKIKIGFAGEKDPGEQFFAGAQSSGMDFYTGYLSLNNIGILRNLVIGNFRASYGQGLTLGSGLSIGSMPSFMLTGNQTRGIKPSLSMNEGNYFRGAAATIKINHVECSGFISYHPRDATVASFDSLESTVGEISSFINTGYHRTATEQAKKNVITELVYGGNISFSMSPRANLGFKFGITGISCRYSAPLAPTIHPYNQFGFCGDRNSNVGIDVQFRYRYYYFFGEISRSNNSEMAWLAGANLTPDPRMGVTIIYRNYEPRYQNLFSNAFGQNSLNANERGFYIAMNAVLHSRVTLSGYMDFFTFPWLRYRTDTPTRGQEYGFIIALQVAKNVLMNFRYYQKNIKRNQTADPDTVVHKLTDYFTKDYRFNIEWEPVQQVLLKSRIEFKETREGTGKKPMGFLLYQDARLKFRKWPLTVTMRYALFDIPDYDSRIYVYEPEVLYGYSVPSYEGKGMRFCMVLHTVIGHCFNVWLRGGWTYYNGRNSIGTGLDQIPGNNRYELTGQLMVRL
ncbi:MAG: helix-hairpin-helix domain-containing protein [Bacteroidales bacterium]|jgi:hypothetical protein|nr:helix-hairpin-helix domain-containing protein [Bacteroidales bacterium]